MYRIVVVDDEPLLLRSIKKSIENAHKGFKIVGEAMNGEDAAGIIADTAPDIVFTDIRMPVMDGLSLIQELHKRQINVKVVILSGYQEFDYAKKALKFGVEDYLLKPLIHEELKELLDRIYTELEELKCKIQYDLLESIAHNNIYAFPAAAQLSRYFEEGKFYGAILLCSGSYCTFNCNWLTPAKDFWLKTDLNSVLKKSTPEAYKYWISDFNSGNEKLVIFSASVGCQSSYNEICKQIYEDLLKEQFPITMVVGTPVTKVDDLPFILQHCKIVQNKSVIFGSSRLVFLENPAEYGGSTESLVDANTEKLLSIFIEKKQLEPFKLELQKLLHLYSERQSPQLRLESMLKHLVYMVQTKDSRLSQNQLMEVGMQIDELISNSFTYQAILDGMLIIFEDLFSYAKNQPLEKTDQRTLADKVENYIKQNYSQQISLQSIAENFGLVLPYLSSIFKKYNGMSPMEYIINLRIEKAKELLQLNPPLALKDISLSIGYDDPYYMSRIFKSVTGKSPTEYRNCV